MDIKSIIAIGGILAIAVSLIGGNEIKTNWFNVGPLTQSTRISLGGVGVILFALLIYFFLLPDLRKENINFQTTQTAFAQTQTAFIESSNIASSTQTTAFNSNSISTVTIGASPETTTNPTSTEQPAYTPTTTLTPTLTSTPIPVPTVVTDLEPTKLCIIYYSVVVKTDPTDYSPKKAILKNPTNISNPACLLFDLRMPDNSWIRIAAKQSDTNYTEFETGWIKSNQINASNFENLEIYIPESVLSGEYCATSPNGIKVRSCPDNKCDSVEILPLGTCLIFDARTADNKWARISQNQNNDQFTLLTGNWVNSYFISPKEFSDEYNPIIQFYLGMLEIVTPIPTPDG